MRNETETNWYPGHIEKAKRRIREKIKAVNSVIELIDARIPYSGRAYEWKEMFSNKHSIILLTKTDLADPFATKKWIEFYKAQGKEVFSINLKEPKEKIKSFFGNLKNSIPSKGGFKRAMIIGIPNVGKSTLVNCLLGKKKVPSANTPGVTKGIQWINVSDDFLLLDTPGILYKNLFSRHVLYKLILTGSVKAEENPVREALFYGFDLIDRKYPVFYKQWLEKNSMEKWESEESFLDLLSSKKGFLLPGNKYDHSRALTFLLIAFSSGKVGKISYETFEELQEIIKGKEEGD